MGLSYGDLRSVPARVTPAYWTVKGCIQDPRRFERYKECSDDILDSFGAEVIATTTRACPEKGCPLEIRAIVRFASRTEAQACLESPRLKSVSKLYEDVCDWTVIIVDGAAPEM